MLYAEVTPVSEGSQILAYTITCPKCGSIKTVTSVSPDLRCKCKNNLGEYILQINNRCVRVADHINGDNKCGR